MKALVTGGTGFIGSHLVEFLSARDVEVFALVRDPNNLKFLSGLNVRLLHGDLHSIPALPPDLDYVFNLAGMTKAVKSADYYTVNQQGTASFFEALRRQGISAKLIHLSSLAACGPSADGHGRREDDPPAPVSHYGKSKLLGEGEALARQDDFPVVIIRVGAVFGPKDADFLRYFKPIMRGFLLSFGFKPQLMSVCYVQDLVRALDTAARKPMASGEILNIGNPIPCSFDDIGRMAGKVLGKEPRRIVIPLSVVFLAALAADVATAFTGRPSITTLKKFPELKQRGWTADVQKARDKIGFETRYSLEEGLRETLGWYQANGWL
jgi:nucleoside-diphosphate-sugar epimerase